MHTGVDGNAFTVDINIVALNSELRRGRRGHADTKGQRGAVIQRNHERLVGRGAAQRAAECGGAGAFINRDVVQRQGGLGVVVGDRRGDVGVAGHLQVLERAGVPAFASLAVAMLLVIASVT